MSKKYCETVQTVTGRVNASDLGKVLMHEHLWCDLTRPGLFPEGTPEREITLGNCWQVRYEWNTFPGNQRIMDPDATVVELKELREFGVNTIAELSCIGSHRDPKMLKKFSEDTGILIVTGTGFYVGPYLSDETKALSEEELYHIMYRELTEGIMDTGIKAGIIGELGCSAELTQFERMVLRAAARVQKETGAAINVHPPGYPEAPKEIVRYIESHGGNPYRTVISHIDRTIFDESTLMDLAKTGCIIEYDFFGIESTYFPPRPIDLPNDGMRLKYIRALAERGHLDQIFISHDICAKTRLKAYGGHGYGHIPRNVVPLMKARGFSDDEVDTILTKNPRRILSIS